MQPEPPLCPECGRQMEFRLGGFECPGCGRMLLPPSLEPEPPETLEPGPSLDAFAQAAAEHATQAAQPAVPATPGLLRVPPGYPFPLTPPPAAALPAAQAREGNHSGESGDSPLPSEASRYTMAAWLPCGIFSFFTGDYVWGVIGLAGVVTVLPAIVYSFYIGTEGRKRAWRMRRFKSVKEFNAVMDAWNTAGLIFTLVGGLVALIIAYVVAKQMSAVYTQMLTGS